MSWQLDQERGIKTKIEMPTEPQVEKTYEVHPDIAKEYTQEEPEQEVVEQETQEEVQVAPEPEKPQPETAQAKNFRELREQKQRIERERDELLRKFQEMEAKKQTKEEPEQDWNINPDDLVEGKHLSKYDKKIRKLQEELEIQKQQNSVVATEARLKARYPDLEKVLSAENIEILRETYPEIADSINANPDLYAKASSAYTLIKKLGIVKEDIYQEDKMKAQKNAAKPKPLASVNPQQGDSPLSKANAFANGLTDELKAQLRKEMLEARKAL